MHEFIMTSSLYVFTLTYFFTQRESCLLGLLSPNMSFFVYSAFGVCSRATKSVPHPVFPAAATLKARPFTDVGSMTPLGGSILFLIFLSIKFMVSSDAMEERNEGLLPSRFIPLIVIIIIINVVVVYPSK